MQKFFILILVIGLSFASNFVTNGDFEQPLSVGWTEYSPGSYGSIARATSYDPDPDYEVYVRRQGSGGLGGGYDTLSQIIVPPISIFELDFSATIKLNATEAGNGSNWAGAALSLYYRDANDALLGITRICRYTSGTPWYNSSTQHLIIAPNTNWNDYSFNIGNELQNLSGVDPSAVAKITVTLIVTAYNC
jgi:hypothetical protein